MNQSKCGLIGETAGAPSSKIRDIQHAIGDDQVGQTTGPETAQIMDCFVLQVRVPGSIGDEVFAGNVDIA